MNVCTPLVTDRKPTEAIHPCQRTLYDPPVFAQPHAGIDTLPGNPAGNASATQVRAAAWNIVGFVRAQNSWTPTLPTGHPTAQGWNGIEHRLEHSAIVNVGRADEQGQWNALPID